MCASSIWVSAAAGRICKAPSGSWRGGGWSGTVLCDRSLDVRDLGAGWTQFRCEPLSSGDEEPLELELRMAGADLGWLVPAFSHPSPLPEDCASIADLGSVGRPLAIQVWSGIPGIDLTAHAGAPRGDTAVAVIAPEQLSMAELASKPPAGLSFTPVSYDTATQSLLVHPLGPRPTVARLPPVSAVNLSALSAIVRLDDARARPAEFALAASVARSVRDGIDPDSLTWHEFKAREWGEIEVTFPEPLNGEVRIHLLTRTRTDDFNYTSAWFRGLRMISAAPAVG